MDPDQQLRNLRDFLLVYNRMTETCFQRCSSNFNYRTLTMDEERCLDSCAGKLIRSNHRLMGTYVQLMPKMVQRRMEEMESKAAENAKAAEAAAIPSAAEALPASQITSASPSEVLPLSTPSVADVRPEAQVLTSTPAGLNIPFELNTALSKSTTSSEVSLSAAAALTPATEAVYPSLLSDTGNGPSYTTGFLQTPIAGAQIESSAPVIIPSKPASKSADVPVSTEAVPVSVTTESLSGHESATENPRGH